MESYVLSIHFGNYQNKHEIKTDSLLAFVESYKELLDLFGYEPAEILIGVPEEGGWKTRLTIIGGIVSFIGINPISILLTGQSSEDWAKKGRPYIEMVNKFLTTKADDISTAFPKECIKLKNKIYTQFQKDTCIDTFQLDQIPFIYRNNFHLYIKNVSDEEYEYLGQTQITIHSPDWKGKRSWKGKIEILNDKESSFDFGKDLTGKFWEKVKLDQLSLHTLTDLMQVQLAKRPTHKIKYWVIRVLSYNDLKVDDKLIDAELSKFMPLIKKEDSQIGKQGELFTD